MAANTPRQPIDRFLAVAARSLVDAQVVLDAHYRESTASRKEEDLPPSAWKWGECGLHVPVALNFISRTTYASVNRIDISPIQDERCGHLKLVIRHLSHLYGAERKS